MFKINRSEQSSFDTFGKNVDKKKNLLDEEKFDKIKISFLNGKKLLARYGSQNVILIL